MLQQAEFNFKESIPAQRQKIRLLQNVVLGVVAFFILLLAGNFVVCTLLELLLLLVSIRIRRSLAMSASLESLTITSKNAAVIIDGSHYDLSTYALDYYSSWIATIRLTTEAGESYCFAVFPSLIGAEKYRQLLALLKARFTEPAR